MADTLIDPAQQGPAWSELVDFINGLSEEIGQEKQGVLALFEGGLAVHGAASDGQGRVGSLLFEADGDGAVSADRALGRVEGEEVALNAIAAFVLARSADGRGELTANQAE